MRKFSWIVPVVVAFCLIGYFLVWPWFRDRGDTAAIDALTAEMKTASDDIEKTIAEVPENPTRKDLQQSIERFGELNQKTRELAPRIRDITPKLKGDAGQRFRDVRDDYLKKIELIGPKLNELQKKIEELKTKQP